ncbi:hypothetical protein VP01_219g3 [Puccinia sorghi]|uniref:Uncharacterized protein n=1 Tax=Puccinia sorghi TaxID=27349 RepID=A0A0L6V9L8_9BASI|nr:hypothetical protein VP01_219g3 [Puccinia sorghi]
MCPKLRCDQETNYDTESRQSFDEFSNSSMFFFSFFFFLIKWKSFWSFILPIHSVHGKIYSSLNVNSSILINSQGILIFLYTSFPCVGHICKKNHRYCRQFGAGISQFLNFNLLFLHLKSSHILLLCQYIIHHYLGRLHLQNPSLLALSLRILQRQPPLQKHNTEWSLRILPRQKLLQKHNLECNYVPGSSLLVVKTLSMRDWRQWLPPWHSWGEGGYMGHAKVLSQRTSDKEHWLCLVKQFLERFPLDSGRPDVPNFARLPLRQSFQASLQYKRQLQQPAYPFYPRSIQWKKELNCARQHPLHPILIQRMKVKPDERTIDVSLFFSKSHFYHQQISVQTPTFITNFDLSIQMQREHTACKDSLPLVHTQWRSTYSLTAIHETFLLLTLLTFITYTAPAKLSDKNILVNTSATAANRKEPLEGFPGMRWYFTSTQSAHHNPFETTGATKHAKIQMKNWNHLSLPANVGATMLPSTLHPHAKSKLQYMTYPLKLVSHIDRMLAMLHYSNFTLTSFHTHRTRLGLSTFTKSSPRGGRRRSSHKQARTGSLTCQLFQPAPIFLCPETQDPSPHQPCRLAPPPNNLNTGKSTPNPPASPQSQNLTPGPQHDPHSQNLTPGPQHRLPDPPTNNSQRCDLGHSDLPSEPPASRTWSALICRQNILHPEPPSAAPQKYLHPHKKRTSAPLSNTLPPSKPAAEFSRAKEASSEELGQSEVPLPIDPHKRDRPELRFTPPLSKSVTEASAEELGPAEVPPSISPHKQDHPELRLPLLIETLRSGLPLKKQNMCTTSSANSVVRRRKHTRKSKIIIQEDCPDTNFCPEVPHITLQCKISGPQTQPLNLTKKAPSPANTHSSFHSMLLPYPNPVTMSKSQAVEPHLNDISTRILESSHVKKTKIHASEANFGQEILPSNPASVNQRHYKACQSQSYDLEEAQPNQESQPSSFHPPVLIKTVNLQASLPSNASEPKFDEDQLDLGDDLESLYHPGSRSEMSLDG